MKRGIISLIFFALFALVSGNVFSQTVYITQTGHRFHTRQCKHVTAQSKAVDLERIISQGYAPCTTCNPPTKVVKAGPKKKKPAAKAKAPVKKKPVPAKSTKPATGTKTK